MKLNKLIRVLKRFIAGGQEGEIQRFLFAEMVSGWIYPKFKFPEFGRMYLEDLEFISRYEMFEGRRNYHSLDRKYALAQLLKLVASIDGATAECGVFKGASSYFICREITGSEREHHIFDSFEGLSQPAASDGVYWSRGDLSCGEEAVREQLKEFPFVRFYKGWIPARFEDVAAKRFSFVHLDVDLYQPTLDSLQFFYPRMTQGGLIVCDDYGFITCPGAKRAFDEYFVDKIEKIVSLPTGQALVQKGSC